MKKFQFPSNGKARSDGTAKYKRLSRAERIGFNSLQTGRLGRTPGWSQRQKKMLRLFQFPSNGKARSDAGRRQDPHSVQNKFQFPSNGKARSDERMIKLLSREGQGFNSLQTGRLGRTILSWGKRLFVAESFNSLQTGRLGRTRLLYAAVRSYSHLFQFPSNGKARSDYSTEIQKK